MKKKIDDKTLDALNILNLKVLMHNHGNLFVIEDFKTITVEEEVKLFFGLKKKMVKNIYLTELCIKGYNRNGKFLGTFTNNGAWRLVYFLNLYDCKQNWLDFKDELKSFGFEITRIKQEDEAKQD